MIVWRISNHVTLDGMGGLKASARWHTKGRRIVYCAPNPATALLEMLVQNEVDLRSLPASYRLFKIEIPDSVSKQQLEPGRLSTDWRQRLDITRRIGDEWLAAASTALLVVPCVIVPETWNLLVNPEHPDCAEIRIVETISGFLDDRLIR